MGLVIGIGNTAPQFAYDYYYGIEWDATVSNPKCTRIGKEELHKSLPLQSLMRRCILKDDGSVAYYLHANDSTKRDNGATANLDGSDGQYMDELPDMYIRFETDGDKSRCLMSEHALPGFTLWGKDYVSAVEATVQRSTNTLCSVVNTDADYRGGNNNSAWDDTYRSLLGRPATAISLTNFRAYARKRGAANWNCNIYHIQRKLWWLFAVEYATFNSQAAFNAELDDNGFRQGGLGNGVTMLDGTKWNEYNGYYPFVPCGITNELGNHTGVVTYTMPEEYDSTKPTVSVPSYRGVENPFGHIWKWTDGCKCIIQSDADGGKSLFYVCDDESYFSSSGIAGYELRGELPRTAGYVKTICLGEHGEIMPSAVGAGSTTYFCDYYYTSIPDSGSSERGVLFGGGAYSGSRAGFVDANTTSAASDANAHLGSRLCFSANRAAA